PECRPTLLPHTAIGSFDLAQRNDRDSRGCWRSLPFSMSLACHWRCNAAAYVSLASDRRYEVHGSRRLARDEIRSAAPLPPRSCMDRGHRGQFWRPVRGHRGHLPTLWKRGWRGDHFDALAGAYND